MQVSWKLLWEIFRFLKQSDTWILFRSFQDVWYLLLDIKNVDKLASFALEHKVLYSELKNLSFKFHICILSIDVWQRLWEIRDSSRLLFLFCELLVTLNMVLHNFIEIFPFYSSEEISGLVYLFLFVFFLEKVQGLKDILRHKLSGGAEIFALANI